MGKGVINPDVINLTVIASALVAAITWNLADLVVWPSFKFFTYSCRRTCRSCCSKFRMEFSVMAGVIKIVIFIVIAPVLGMVMSFIISAIVIFFARNHSPSGIDKHFRRLQLLSAAAFSLGHGGNDAQKSMGIIWVALIVSGLATKTDPIALWIVLSCQAAIAFGNISGRLENCKDYGTENNQTKTI